MKKTATAALILGLMTTIFSCKKNSDPGGYWIFQAQTYYVAGCTAGAAGTLNASDANANNPLTYGTLGFNFYQALPVSSGTYQVVRTPTSSDQVSVILSIDGTTDISYASTGGNGTETVKVSVNNGLVSVAGTGIMMLNASGGTDSSTVTLNVTQTN